MHAPPSGRRAPSDHFDGARFFNPGQLVARRGFGAFLRWRLGHRRRPPWPDRVEDPPFPPPPGAVAPGIAAVSFIGHATFLIRLPGLVVLTDPIFSARCSPLSWAGPKRVRPPGIALAALPRIDLVLLSHNHYDHTDLPSLRALRERDAPRVVATLGNAALLAKAGIPVAAELDWWESRAFGGWRVTATPARHFSARTPFDRNRTLWAGFMLAAPQGDGRVLFAGDSAAGPHWHEIRARLGPPDLALLPIGAYEPRWLMAPAHMNPEEAVAAHLALGARRSLGMHFGTFRLTDEAIDAPVTALAAARQAAGLAPSEFDVAGFGETRLMRLGRDVAG